MVIKITQISTNMHRYAQTSLWDVSAFRWWAGAFCLKTPMYSHFNWRTMPHHRRVSIDVLAFSAVLPYFVWERRYIPVPINTATATASYIIDVPPVSEHTMKIWKISAVQCFEISCSRTFIHVNIPWTSGQCVLSRVRNCFVHVHGSEHTMIMFLG